jgi:hypothetical protein
MMRVSTWAIFGLLAGTPLPAFADGIVIGPPVVSYYAPPTPVLVPAAGVSYYSGPAPIVTYAVPAPYYAAPIAVVPGPTVTTYRYGVFGLRTVTTSSYYPPPVIQPVLRPRVVLYPW